jgi:hypothetical protein
MEKSDFRVLDGSEFELFTDFCKENRTFSCERSWANLQLYSDTYNWHCANLHGRLWIASFDAGFMFYPLGENTPPDLLCLELAAFKQICSDTVTCGDIPYNYAEIYPDAGAFLALEDDPGDYDYIYDLQHLQSFSGSRLRKRHNQVRQFEREYSECYTVEKITPEKLPQVVHLAAELSCAYWSDSTGEEEKFAFNQLQQRWNDSKLALDGILLNVGDKLAGFSVFSALDSSIADIHFEKADRNYAGCAAKLTAALVEYLLTKNFQFMNREQDLNEEGLKRAKRALDPVMLYKRLSARL